MKKQDENNNENSSMVVLIAVSCAIAGCVFLFDTTMPLGVAGGVPYVALVMVGLWFPQANAVFYLAVIATVLTSIGYSLSEALGIPWMVMVNRALAYFAIWVSAALAYQIKQRELALVDARNTLEQKVAERTSELTKEMEERKQAESKARQLQDNLAQICRMSEVVETTTVFAHELNQPLSVISSYAQGILGLLDEEDEGTREAARKIQEQAERASAIIKSTREQLKNEKTARTNVNMTKFVEEVLGLFESEFAENQIDIKTELNSSLPNINAVPVQIQQVLINLIRNSIEACQENGRSSKKIFIQSQLGQNDLIEVVVEDNGRGIKKEANINLFKPFYTTKKEGLGMGLPISHSIIESHGGSLWHETPSSGGARFHMTLPVNGEG